MGADRPTQARARTFKRLPILRSVAPGRPATIRPMPRPAPTRRPSQVILLWFCLLPGSCGLPQPLADPEPPDATPRPNILLIVCEGLGVGDLGCYGQRRVATPRIDALARGGRRSLHAYAASPAATATQHSILSGRHSGRAALRADAAGPAPAGSLPLFEAMTTAGYRAGFFGVWRQGGPDSPGSPAAAGVPEFFGVHSQETIVDHFPPELFHNDEPVALPGNDQVPQRQFLSDEVLAAAGRFLAPRPDARPVFLYLHLPLPQPGMQVPRPLLDAQRGRFPELPYPGGPHPAQADPRAARAAMLHSLDTGVGGLLDQLRRPEGARQTLVILTSSHGPQQVAGADPRFFLAHGGHRDGPENLVEGRIRVPLILHWPGAVPAGSRDEDLRSSQDLAATLLDLAGAAALPGRDGHSLLDRLEDKRGYLYFEHQGWQALRIGPHKGVRAPGATRLRIYDLLADPGETKDRAAELGHVRRQMELSLQVARQPVLGR